jgi:membrane-associated phospholipid phosphatase
MSVRKYWDRPFAPLVSVVAGTLVAFALLAAPVRDGRVAEWDESLSEAVHGAEEEGSLAASGIDPLDLAVRPAVDLVGGLALVGLAAVLIARGRSRAAVFLAAAAVGVLLLAPVLKELFERPPLHEEGDGYSFPSGHAMRSMAAAAAVVLLAWPTRWRWPIAIVGSGVVAVLGLALVYNGWHWPSDVLAGWCVALAWVAVLWYAVSPTAAAPAALDYQRRRPAARKRRTASWSGHE